MHKNFIIGLNGKQLTTEERRWLRENPPLGVILFGRNIGNPEQVKSLLAAVRDCTGEMTWAAIDEEGGRINRIFWPPFSERRPAAEYGHLMQQDGKMAEDLVYQDNLRVGQALAELGFTHNCAPVLDIFHLKGHDIIGERAYANHPDIVGALGKACMRGLSDAGIDAVGKHFPGHGRANADSHIAIPTVDASLDVLLSEAQPFRALIKEGIQHIMTAHVVYQQVTTPVATCSSFWLRDVLQRQFNFKGHIWSDDLCMQGVGNDVRDAADKAMNAGCDVLLVCEPQGVTDIYTGFMS